MRAWRLDALDFALDPSVGVIAITVYAVNRQLNIFTPERFTDFQKYVAALLLPRPGKPMLTEKRSKGYARDKQLSTELEHQKQNFLSESLSELPVNGSMEIEVCFEENGVSKEEVVEATKRGSVYVNVPVELIYGQDDHQKDFSKKTALGTLLLDSDMMDLDLQVGPTNTEQTTNDDERINTLKAKISQQSEMLKQCRCTELRSQVSTLTISTQLLTTEKTTIIERLTVVESQLKNSNNDNTALRNKIAELEALLATKDAALLASTAAMAQNTNTLNDKSKTIENLQSAMEDSNHILALVQSAKDSLDAECKQLRGELAALQSVNDAYSSEINGLSKELESVILKRNSNDSSLNEQVANLQKTIADDNSNIASLKQAKDMLMAEVDKLSGLLSEARAKATVDANTIARLTHDMEALKADQAMENEGIKKVDADLKAQLDRLSAELTASQSAMTQNAQQASLVAAHEAKVAELMAELDNLKTAEATLKDQLLASQLAHQTAVAKHHAAAANNFGSPTKQPQNKEATEGLSPKDSNSRLTGGDLKFAEMEDELYEVRYKVIEHHNELIALIASIHLEAPLAPLQPIDAGNLPKTRVLFTPQKHSTHDVDLSGGRVSDLQVSITSNKARLAAMLEMGENLKKGGSRQNVLDGSGLSNSGFSRRGSEISMHDSNSSSSNLLGSRRTSRLSVTEFNPDTDLLSTPLKSSPLNPADDARATQLLQHIQELSAIVDTDALIIERLRIVVDLVNRQLDSQATSLKDACKKVLELENVLHAQGSHVDERINIINKLQAERNSLEKTKNDEITKLKFTIADITGKLSDKTAELLELHTHVKEIESHVHFTSVEFHSIYTSSSKTITSTTSSSEMNAEVDTTAANTKRMSLLTKTLDNYKTHLAEKNEELKKALSDVTKLQDQLTSVNKQLIQSVSEKDSINVLYLALLEDQKKQQLKLTDTESMLKSAGDVKKQLDTMNIEHVKVVSALNVQIADLQAAQRATASEKKQLLAECDDVKRQVNELITQARRAEDSHGTTNTQVTTLKNEISGLQTKLQEAQRQVDEAKALIKSRDGLLLMKEESIVTFEKKLADTTAELATTRKELNELKRSIAELESSMVTQNNEHSFDELILKASQATSGDVASHHVRGSMNVTRMVTTSVQSSTVKSESHVTHRSDGVNTVETHMTTDANDSSTKSVTVMKAEDDKVNFSVSETYSSSSAHAVSDFKSTETVIVASQSTAAGVAASKDNESKTTSTENSGKRNGNGKKNNNSNNNKNKNNNNKK